MKELWQQFSIPDTHTHRESTVATMIEEQTAKLPSDNFLWTAIGAIAVSAAVDRKHKEV